MADRRDQNGATEQFHELFGADAFLDDLSRGVDSSKGNDPLAQLFLELHEEVNAPMPPAPRLDELLPDEQGDRPDELASRRSRHAERRHASPWAAGLVGAAAATLVIAGAGGAIYNASPSSPLWNAKMAVFGERAAVVDLASALQEADERHSQGDIDGAMKLIDRARVLADAVNSGDRESTRRALAELEARTSTAPTTVTENTTVTSQAETATSIQQVPAEPITTTVTETVINSTRVTVTVTQDPAPTSAHSTSTQEPSPTTTITFGDEKSPEPSAKR